MRNTQIRVLLLIIGLFISFDLSSQDETISFKYDKEKYCGSFNIDFKGKNVSLDFTGKDTDTLVIELEGINKSVLELNIRNLEFGFDKKCSSKVKPNHKNTFFLESVPRRQFIGFHRSAEEENVIISEKDGSTSRVYIGRFIFPIENLKKTVTGKLELEFLIKKGDKFSSKTVVEKNYKIIPSKIEKKESDIIDTNYIAAKGTNESEIVEKEINEESKKTIHIESIFEKEQRLWSAINETLNKQFINDRDRSKAISHSCYQYRNTLKNDFQSFPRFEKVLFLSIENELKSNIKNTLCSKYFEKYPDGELAVKVKKICKEKPKNNTSKLSAQEKEDNYWYEKIIIKNEPKYYQRYIKKYGNNAIHFEEAKEKLEEFVIQETSREDIDSATVAIKYSFFGNESIPPGLKVLSGKDFIVDTLIVSRSGLKVKIQEGELAVIAFEIPDSPWKKNIIEVDAAIEPLEAKDFINESSYLVSFSEIRNGKTPYEVDLVDTEIGTIAKSFIVNNDSWSIKYDTISEISAGKYKFRLRDKTQSYSIISDEFYIEKETSDIEWWMYAIPIFILGITFISIFYKTKTKKEIIPVSDLPEPINSEKELILEATDVSILENRTSIRNRIKVHHKKGTPFNKIPNPAKSFEVNDMDYYSISMPILWEDSLVDKIFLHRRCIAKIEKFVFENAKSHLLPDGRMPEIGGFLLGKYQKTDDHFQLACEEFVDIEPEENGVYQISFGAKAWSKLEKEFEIHNQDSEYEILGWFHTHPGHGLFLSRPDLNIHENFFKHSFQVAMEIDNVRRELNPSFDVGFFSRKTNGSINNQHDLLEKWFQWKDIVEWHKLKNVKSDTA